MFVSSAVSRENIELLFPSFEEEGGILFLTLSVLPSILPSVTNIFCRTFHCNHASQPLQACYGTLARVLKCLTNKVRYQERNE